MLRLATDADVHGAIIRGLRRHAPTLDLLRVQDALPEAASDQQVLTWATTENRILISNDRNTMVAEAIKKSTRAKTFRGSFSRLQINRFAPRSRISSLSQSLCRT